MEASSDIEMILAKPRAVEILNECLLKCEQAESDFIQSHVINVGVDLEEQQELSCRDWTALDSASQQRAQQAVFDICAKVLAIGFAELLAGEDGAPARGRVFATVADAQAFGEWQRCACARVGL